MHIALRHIIEQGDIYFVAYPRWSGTFVPDPQNPTTYWHQTSVFKVLTPMGSYTLEELFDPDVREKVFSEVKVPFGTQALVLQNPGEGVEAKFFEKWYERGENKDVLCLVTNPDSNHSFVAVVGAVQLWEQDPRKSPP